MNAAKTLWITGLSGAGKSSLAHAVTKRLRAQGEHVVLLDGDELREVFGAVAAHTVSHCREGSHTLAMQ